MPTHRPPEAGRRGTQNVVFATAAGWTEDTARAWLAERELDASALELRADAWQAPQFPAADCAPGSLTTHTEGLPSGIGIVRARRAGRLEPELERRDTLAPRAQLEVRREAGRGPRLRGYAAVFDQPTTLWPGYREVIRPGAFARALREGQDVRGLWNHDPGRPLGRSTISKGPGSLRLWEDDHGLGFELEPLDTADGETVLKATEAGVVTGSSFAFHARGETELEHADHVLREIHDADLVDVSPVTYPQYTGASVALRSLRDLGPLETGPALLAALRHRGLTDAAISAMLERAAAELSPHSGATPRRDRLARSLRERTLQALDI